MNVTRRLQLVIVTCGLLAGCAKAPGPVSVIADKPRTIKTAAECVSSDPAWSEVPDRDVKRAELARLWRENRQKYRTVIAARRVCRASVRSYAAAGR